MRVPVQWLADYVDLDLSTEELAHRLTMAGLKVEAIERIGVDWQDVLIGEVVDLQPHPSSKNPLNVARVDVNGQVITVVTGAPNVARGDRVPVVLVGGLLPHGPDGNAVTIQARPMAGITSEGMLASGRELGISDDRSGIYTLPPDAPVGDHLRNYLGGDVLDIETTPNRPDTLSIIGIAREVAAITAQQMTLGDPTAITETIQPLDEESISVQIEDARLCPRYSALRIEGIDKTGSPSWLADRLAKAGMRPISLIVDITNYVMLEYGQPMHAFDAARLRERIVVRRAHDGERLRTLDGVERALTPDDLVIADAERAVALAGVMGGEDSEVTEATTAIVLESATFDPISVRRTALRLGLRSEASSRFEKGLPAEQTIPAAQRFLQLLVQITGKCVRVARFSDVWPVKPGPRTVRMPLRDLRRLLGLDISLEQAGEALSLLGFAVTIGEDGLAAQVPYWRRVDILQSADLVEEVARMVGYDAVPSTLPRRTMKPPATPPEIHWRDVVRERLLAGGASEAVTHSLTSASSMSRLFPPGSNGHHTGTAEYWAGVVANPAGVYARGARTEPVRLMNPATREREVLRVTILPALVDVIARNLKHTREQLSFFEIDHTFFARPEDLPYERWTLAVALSGSRRPRTWQEKEPGPYSFYDLKGLVEAVLDALHVPHWTVEAAMHPALHPGRSAVLRVDGHDVGYLGELHPEVTASFEIEGWPVQVAELDLDTIVESASDSRVFHPLPRFPSALRDIAVVVDADVPAAAVLSVVRGSAGQVLETAGILDVYSGEQVPAGKKSIAVALEFRAPGSTLTEEEVSTVMQRIVSALAQGLDATLRE